MCGRYFLTADDSDIVNHYKIDKNEIGSFQPHPEIFPSNLMPVVVEKKYRNLKLMRWGFSPSFSSSLVINARAETIDRKSLFRKSFLKRRCVIPSTGFFEWKTSRNQKEKYKITLKNEHIISLAGIYDIFIDKNNQKILSYTIITTSASKELKTIHPRMPVIVDKDKESQWLNQSSDQKLLYDVLVHSVDKGFNVKRST